MHTHHVLWLDTRNAVGHVRAEANVDRRALLSAVAASVLTTAVSVGEASADMGVLDYKKVNLGPNLLSGIQSTHHLALKCAELLSDTDTSRHPDVEQQCMLAALHLSGSTFKAAINRRMGMGPCDHSPPGFNLWHHTARLIASHSAGKARTEGPSIIGPCMLTSGSMRRPCNILLPPQELARRRRKIPESDYKEGPQGLKWVYRDSS